MPKLNQLNMEALFLLEELIGLYPYLNCVCGRQKRRIPESIWIRMKEIVMFSKDLELSGLQVSEEQLCMNVAPARVAVCAPIDKDGGQPTPWCHSPKNHDDPCKCGELRWCNPKEKIGGKECPEYTEEMQIKDLRIIGNTIKLMRNRLECGQGSLEDSMCRLSLPMAELLWKALSEAQLEVASAAFEKVKKAEQTASICNVLTRERDDYYGALKLIKEAAVNLLAVLDKYATGSFGETEDALRELVE